LKLERSHLSWSNAEVNGTRVSKNLALNKMVEFNTKRTCENKK